MIWIGIVIGIFLGEYFLKNQIERNQERDRRIVRGKIIITKSYNYGAALNLGEKHPKRVLAFSCFIVGIGMVVFLWLLGKRKSKYFYFGMSLLLGGGMSNTYDRIKRGYVVDYIEFNTRWKVLNRIVFNLSDFLIFLGSVLILAGRTKKV